MTFDNIFSVNQSYLRRKYIYLKLISIRYYRNNRIKLKYCHFSTLYLEWSMICNWTLNEVIFR